jgi:hypothetical protein
VKEKVADKFLSRWGWRKGQGVIIRKAAGWQFQGNTKNLIELCHDALEAVEIITRQAIVKQN